MSYDDHNLGGDTRDNGNGTSTTTDNRGSISHLGGSNGSNIPGTSGHGNGGGASSNSEAAINTSIQYSSEMATPEFLQIADNIAHWEGNISHMYADLRGNVTVGIGSYIPDIATAQHIPFEVTDYQRHGRPNKYHPASASEIESEFNRIKNIFNNAKIPKEQKNGAYAKGALHLNETERAKLLAVHIDNDRRALRTLFNGFDSFPLNAKIAIHDMAYQLGIGGLANKFPSFDAAVRRGDWLAAAKESHRPDAQKSRNKNTEIRFSVAAHTGH